MTFRYPRLQQQFIPRTSTSAYDCTATTGGMLADADSRGKLVFNHSQVRLATNEPHPDPGSPGLRWEQVDAALLALSNGRVNLDVRPIGTSFGVLPPAVRSGKWAGVAIWRGVLVDAGLGGNSPFREGHAEILGYDQDRKVPVLGDPLIPHWQDVSWSIVRAAMEAFTHRFGRSGAYFALTRDVFDESAQTLRYAAIFAGGPYFAYTVAGGQIAGRTTQSFSKATSAPCSAPETYPWAQGGARKLVRVTTGAIAGTYVEPGTTNVTLRVTKV